MCLAYDIILFHLGFL